MSAMSSDTVGVAQINLAGELMLVNDRYCEVLGYSRGELLGASLVDYTHPNDLEKLLTMRRRLLANEATAYTTHMRCLRKDGAIAWVRLRGSLMQDKDNRPQCFLAVVDDITDHVKTTELLRQAEARLKNTQRLARMGTWEWEIQANRVVWSEEVSAIFGRSRHDEVDYERFLQAVAPTDRERVDRAVRDCLEAASERSIEFQIARPDGEVRWVACVFQGWRDGAGLPLRMSSACQDITERKRAEAKLRASEERFRSLADSALVMMRVSGSDELCSFFNRGWLKFTGRTMEQELGSGWKEGIHPDDLQQYTAVYSSSFDARRDFQVEYRLRRADGEHRWVREVGSPMFGPDGAFEGYISSCVEITEAKGTPQETVARQKLQSLGVIAGSVAHDVANLLGSILANADLVLNDLAEGRLDQEGPTRIRTAAMRGEEILRQLMTYTGEQKEAFEPVDISALIREMLELLKMSISKRARLRLNLPEKLPLLHANAAQLRQVVMNLITNASEALGDRVGLVTVSVEQIRPVLDSSAQHPPPTQLDSVGSQRYGLRHDTGDPDQDLRSVFHNQVSRSRHGSCLGAGNSSAPRWQNKCSECSGPRFYFRDTAAVQQRGVREDLTRVRSISMKPVPDVPRR